jgi:hypothetical protein
MKLGSFDALVHALQTAGVRSRENIQAAFSALAGIGYRPIVPINAADFDVFVTEPFDFDAEYARALVKRLGSIEVRFVSIPSLIRMKEIAGRPQDKIDIEYLRKLADGAN